MDETKSRDINLLKPFANAFNLSYVAFGASITDPMTPAYGHLNLSEAFGRKPLEPAPVTPIDNAAPFKLLSGTIKATFNSHRGMDGNDTIIISPGLTSSNTGEYPASGLYGYFSVIGRYQTLLEPYTSYLSICSSSSRRRRGQTAYSRRR